MFHAAGMKQMITAHTVFIGNYEFNGTVDKLWLIPQDNIKTVLGHWMKGKGSVSCGKEWALVNGRCEQRFRKRSGNFRLTERPLAFHAKEFVLWSHNLITLHNIRVHVLFHTACYRDWQAMAMDWFAANCGF